MTPVALTRRQDTRSRLGADTGVSSPRENAVVDVLHGLTFADVLREQRRSRPEQVAVVDGDFGRDVRLTYPELDDRSNRLANALAAAGVGHGDRILWLGQNSFRVVETLAAAAELRAVVFPPDPRQNAADLAVRLPGRHAQGLHLQEERE